MGFESTTPIQALTLPVTLDGMDVVGEAQTGTGKTAAFAIPVLENLESERVPQASSSVRHASSVSRSQRRSRG